MSNPAENYDTEDLSGAVTLLAALGLGLYAFRSRNREIRNVAILVIAVGAVASSLGE